MRNWSEKFESTANTRNYNRHGLSHHIWAQRFNICDLLLPLLPPFVYLLFSCAHLCDETCRSAQFHGYYFNWLIRKRESVHLYIVSCINMYTLYMYVHPQHILINQTCTYTHTTSTILNSHSIQICYIQHIGLYVVHNRML